MKLLMFALAGVGLAAGTAAAQCGRCQGGGAAGASVPTVGRAVYAPAGGSMPGMMAGMPGMMTGMPAMSAPAPAAPSVVYYYLTANGTLVALTPAPVAAPAPQATGHEHHHGTAAPAAALPVLALVDAAEEPTKDVKPGKEVRLTGTLVCGKCKLKEFKKCTNVLQVKEGEKVVNYYLDDKGNGEDYHEGICGDGEKPGVTVTGTVTEKDGKKWVKATKVTEKK